MLVLLPPACACCLQDFDEAGYILVLHPINTVHYGDPVTRPRIYGMAMLKAYMSKAPARQYEAN